MDNPTPGGTDPKDIQPLARSVARRYFGRHADEMYTYGVDGSGSCFFHSVMVALNPYDFVDRRVSEQKKLADAFRCRIKDMDTPVLRGLNAGMRHNIVRDLCKPRKWAETVMISHTRDILGLNLVFLDDSKGFRIYCKMPGNFHHPLVIVRWVSNRHFEPIVRIKREGDKPQALFRPGVPEDDEIIQSLLKQFTKQCGRPKGV